MKATSPVGRGDDDDRRPSLLLGIDLEDPRSQLIDGQRYADRVPELLARYLGLLTELDIRTTFFVVGELARRHPDLIRQIAAAGHEIGCHTDTHQSLAYQTPESLRADLERNLDALAKAGVTSVQGFRAPVLSLTQRTAWAYPVLAKLGFTYSSSVLPGRNPLHGWPAFGRVARQIDGIWEIPVTVTRWGHVPLASGTYLRTLPLVVVRAAAKRLLARGESLVGYVHPYDIDLDQERYTFPELEGRPLFNWLMYYNRRSVFPKLRCLAELGFEAIPYRQYVARLGANTVPAPQAIAMVGARA